MDTEAIRELWEQLAGRRTELIDSFYAKLFERHPSYRALFPESMAAQREKMVEMIGSLARFADHVDLIRPYLVSVGFAHRKTGIGAGDVENFKEAFVATLAELAAESWSGRQEAAWRDAFDEMIVPLFDEGLETGAAQGGG